MAIKKGDKIKVEYTGTFDDGTVFDSTERQGSPLEFEAGAGMLIKGFDDAVMGMELDEEKDIKLKPKDAYGNHNPQLIKKVPREQFGTDQEPKAGMMLAVGLPTGQQIPAMIVEVNDKDITLDLNHPLADKNLNFRIKVVAIN